MTLREPSEIRNVTGLQPFELTAIKLFLQGAVYCWCKNQPGEWLSVRNLMGGENFYWQGTPLIALYRKHEGSPDALEKAAIDAGWLLKAVIAEDQRAFDRQHKNMTSEYRWVPSDA